MAKRKWTEKLHPRNSFGRFMSKLTDVDPGLLGDADIGKGHNPNPIFTVYNKYEKMGRFAPEKESDSVPVYNNNKPLMRGVHGPHEFIWGTTGHFQEPVEYYWSEHGPNKAAAFEVAEQGEINGRIFMPGRDPDIIQGKYHPVGGHLVVWQGDQDGTQAEYPDPETMDRLRDRYPNAKNLVYNGKSIPALDPEQYQKLYERGRQRQEKMEAIREAETHLDPMSKYYRAQEFAEADYPKLKEMDSQSLFIDDYGSHHTEALLRGLDKVPDKLFTKWARLSGTKVYLGDRPMSQMDEQEEFAVEKPSENGTAQVRKDATYDDMRGVFTQEAGGGKISVGDNGDAHTVLHEFGHSIDHWAGITGFDSEGEDFLVDAHHRLFPKLRPYIQQRGPGSPRGVSELWADGFADVIMDEDNARRKYDNQFVNLVKDSIEYVEEWYE